LMTTFVSETNSNHVHAPICLYVLFCASVLFSITVLYAEFDAVEFCDCKPSIRG
jgi:hypothetical protein